MVAERLYTEKTDAEHRYRALVDGAPDAIVVYDVELGRLIDANRKAEDLFGCNRDELLKGGPERFYTSDQPDGRPTPESFHENNARALAGKSLLFERDVMNAAGRVIHAEVRIGRLPPASRRLIRGSFLDVSERKAAEAKLRFLATHDDLTVLPNRMLLQERLDQAMQAAAQSGKKVALMFLDLDSFKAANDSYGHLVGDELLKSVASRLIRCVRACDMVSRQGGDEFLLLLTDISDAKAAASAAEHILTIMQPPHLLDERELYTSVSIGISIYPDDGLDFVTLRKKADLAMYRAKADGKNTYRFFDPKVDFDVIEHHRAAKDLQGALSRNEFELYFQPQFNLKSRALIGAEALLRWKHPTRGMVSPAVFIPLAESTGQIVEIGSWVLYEACRQAAVWQKNGLTDLVVAVNLSAVQFKRSNLQQIIAGALAESGLPPERLELELTESILISDTESVFATVKALRAMGIKLSIDDFGTGYSSLSYLKRFEVDKVKIDQSFVRDVAVDPGDAAIVKAICMMARGLNLLTIAEGVEEESHLEVLREFSCDEVQGYFFAHPMPAAEFLTRALSGF